jgi:hypothetical protein
MLIQMFTIALHWNLSPLQVDYEKEIVTVKK